MAPSQEDEWKWMVDQDPHSGSVIRDSVHGIMTATGKDESIDNIKELIGAVGGLDESVATEHLSDVKWRDEDTLFAASTPIRTCEEEDQAVSSIKSPLGKKPCF